MTNIEEIEKNLNYVEDMTHNAFKFKVKNMSNSEAIVTYYQLKRKGKIIEACDIADDFFKEFEKAILVSGPYTNLRKPHFNTLKELLKNVIRNNKPK